MASIIKPIMLDETGQAISNTLNTIKNNIIYVKGDKGNDGNDYIITNEDYDVIADVTKPKVVAQIEPQLNEIESIAKGANKAIAFDSYSTMITAFNNLNGTEYKIGQNVYIVTLGVPDLWILDVEEISEEYTYISDEDFITSLNAGGVQVGHYVFAMLETQKVDLTNYVKNIDYATSNKAGVIKLGNGININSSSGIVYTNPITLEQYINAFSGYSISRGTLENIKSNYVKEGMAENMSYDEETETLTITTE